MPRRITAKQLRPLCAFLQDELRLRDWSITLRVVRGLTVNGAPAWASVEPYWNTMTAEICLRPEWDIHPALGHKPVEWCLIHELLHVVFPAVRPANGEEAAINRVADALYRAWGPSLAGMIRA